MSYPRKREYRSDKRTQPPTGKSETNHAKKRQQMRSKLRKRGYSEAEIADVIERMHFEQDCARLGEEAARQLRYDRIKSLDDKGYKPKRVDPLLNGVARATGETAKAVKAKKAIVK